jgi:hypothetical protein
VDIEREEPGSDWSVAVGEEVAACAGRTLAARSARIEVREDFDHSYLRSGKRRRRQGGLLRPVGKLASLVLSAAWKLATRDLNFGHLVGEGVLQPSAGRYMVDYGSWAVLYRDSDFFGGRSGRRLETLEPWHAFHQDEVLWLLRLMCGTTKARVEGHETLRETSCTKLMARVDMARASALHDGGLRAPAVEHFEVLLALQVTVWTDDRFIRRVHFDHEQKKQLTLELWDFDVPTDEFDWSRLPTFKSPEEAAYYAGARISRRERLARMFRARTGKRRRSASRDR